MFADISTAGWVIGLASIAGLIIIYLYMSIREARPEIEAGANGDMSNPELRDFVECPREGCGSRHTELEEWNIHWRPDVKSVSWRRRCVRCGNTFEHAWWD